MTQPAHPSGNGTGSPSPVAAGPAETSLARRGSRLRLIAVGRPSPDVRGCVELRRASLRRARSPTPRGRRRSCRTPSHGGGSECSLLAQVAFESALDEVTANSHQTAELLPRRLPLSGISQGGESRGCTVHVTKLCYPAINFCNPDKGHRQLLALDAIGPHWDELPPFGRSYHLMQTAAISPGSPPARPRSSP
jgi:hypothetical protein